MSNITLTCAAIQTTVGFLYKVLPIVFNQALNPDCEQSWYSKELHLIADGNPSAAYTPNEPVVDVTPYNLTMSYCVDELFHEIICHASGFSHMTTYRAWNETAPTSNPAPVPQTSDQWFWLFVLVIPIFLALIIFKKRRTVLGCFQSAKQLSQKSPCPPNDSQDTSTYRDLEAGVMKLLNDSQKTVELKKEEKEEDVYPSLFKG